ncbi:MAG: cation acetate symporter [Armatimonadetes bacterium]|nr:cation acetate symporter [Armatimonadota bacterium]
MTAEVWTYILVSITFMLYLYIGWSARVRETKGFYVAGQGVPPLANGAATAADWMSAATFISMAGMLAATGYDGSVYLMGWTGGFVLLALLLAPYLRKFGRYTVPDFVGARYYSQTARLLAACAAMFISMTYVAGQMRGVGIVFSRFLQVEIATGVMIGMVIVGFFAILGGMKGITWTQVMQYGVLIAAYLVPAVAVSWQLTGQPLPQFGLVFTDLTARLNQIQVDLGFSEYTAPFQVRTKLDMFCVTAALMVGTAGLPHVIVRFYTVPSVRAARWSAGWALLFIGLLYTTAPAVAAMARYNLVQSLHNKTIAEIEGLDWARKWSQTGLLRYVDKNGDGRISLGPKAAFLLKADGKPDFDRPDPATVNEVFLDNDIVVLSNPEVAKLAPWVIALVAAGGLAAALSTASGLLLVISSAIAHDIYVHLINPHASEAKRLRVGRATILAALVVAAYVGVNPPGFVAEVVAFAFGLAAASFFPLLHLGVFDRRANREGAIAGMLVGLLFTTGYIVGVKFLGMPRWCFGISAEGIGAVGMALNFLTVVTVSRLTPPPPQSVLDLVDSVRLPHDAAPALKLDEESV